MMRITERQLRKVIRENIPKNDDKLLNEFLMDMLKGLLGDLFSGLGDLIGDISGQVMGELEGAADGAAQEVQDQIEREDPKAWADLKPKEDNTDKAVWALTIEKVMSGSPAFNEAYDKLGEAFNLESIAPDSAEPEAVTEWESGPDKQKLEATYEGIGYFKGVLEWMATHTSGAQTAADSIDERAKLSEVLSQVATASEFISNDIVAGLESAAAAVEATGDTSFGTGIGNVKGFAENVAQNATLGSEHVSELEAQAEEKAKAAEEAGAGDPASGMPESRRRIREYVRGVLIEQLEEEEDTIALPSMQWVDMGLSGLGPGVLDRIWSMYTNTYLSMGMDLSASSASGLTKYQGVFLIDVDDPPDGVPDAFIIYKPTAFGKKIALLGTCQEELCLGKRAAKSAVVHKMFELLNSGGYFIEAGEKIEQILSSSAVPPVCDEEKIKEFLGKKFVRFLDDCYYERKLAMASAIVTKRIYGSFG